MPFPSLKPDSRQWLLGSTPSLSESFWAGQDLVMIQPAAADTIAECGVKLKYLYLRPAERQLLESHYELETFHGLREFQLSPQALATMGELVYGRQALWRYESSPVITYLRSGLSNVEIALRGRIVSAASLLVPPEVTVFAARAVVRLVSDGPSVISENPVVVDAAAGIVPMPAQRVRVGGPLFLASNLVDPIVIDSPGFGIQVGASPSERVAVGVSVTSIPGVVRVAAGADLSMFVAERVPIAADPGVVRVAAGADLGIFVAATVPIAADPGVVRVAAGAGLGMSAAEQAPIAADPGVVRIGASPAPSVE